MLDRWSAFLIRKCEKSLRVTAEWLQKQFTGPVLVDWLVLAAATLVAIWLWTKPKPPPPGSAIGVLGVVAAIMTFSKPTSIQRGLVMILAVGLYFLEMDLISKDRISQQRSAQAQTNQIIAANNLQTKGILDENQRALSATMSQFGAISSDAKLLQRSAISNLIISRDNFLNLTGGNSFAYVVPQNFRQKSIPLVLWNAGDYTLTGVTVRIDRETEFPFTGTQEAVGTIPPHQHRLLLTEITPSMKGVTAAPGDKNYFDSYSVGITAQNGLITELIEFRPSNEGGWAQRFWLRKEECKKKGRLIPKCQIAGPSFKYPEDVSLGAWSDGREIK